MWIIVRDADILNHAVVSGGLDPSRCQVLALHASWWERGACNRDWSSCRKSDSLLHSQRPIRLRSGVA